MTYPARRRFLFMTAALVASTRSNAQPSRDVVRIGILSGGYEEANAANWRVFRARLQELGYVEGRNLVIEKRFADGARAQLPALAAQLVALGPNVIVAAGTPPTRVAMKATSTIPIVMTGSADPVGSGLVSSLARPGGNVTGQSMAITDISAKWIEILTELAPRAKEFGFLGDSGNTAIVAVHRSIQRVAGPRGVSVRMFEAVSPGEVDAAFEVMVRANYGGFMVAASTVLAPRSQQIVERALQARLPAVYAREEYVEAGGLMSYITDRKALFRRAADYVHRIVQGAKPSELPVEQVSNFRLAVNLKTARAMGLTLPQSILIRADRVVE
jgi:ABC-type uncharacterized transport system substrate-binding protein